MRVQTKMKYVLLYCIFIVAIMIDGVSLGEELKPVTSMKLSGDIIASDNVSAIAKVGSFLVIGSDEVVGKKKNKNFIQVLKMI